VPVATRFAPAQLRLGEASAGAGLVHRSRLALPPPLQPSRDVPRETLARIAPAVAPPANRRTPYYRGEAARVSEVGTSRSRSAPT
jgi:hypothetical protein